jgi:hypothetical protein
LRLRKLSWSTCPQYLWTSSKSCFGLDDPDYPPFISFELEERKAVAFRFDVISQLLYVPSSDDGTIAMGTLGGVWISPITRRGLDCLNHSDGKLLWRGNAKELLLMTKDLRLSSSAVKVRFKEAPCQWEMQTLDDILERVPGTDDCTPVEGMGAKVASVSNDGLCIGDVVLSANQDFWGDDPFGATSTPFDTISDFAVDGGGSIL